MGFYDNLPGYKNPMGTSGSSWGGSSIDWSKGNGIDWGKGSPSFGVADENDPILGSKKSGYTGKYQNLFEKSNPWEGREARAEAKWGSPTGGSAGQVLENLGYIVPPQGPSMFIPGQESRGKGGTIGSIVGMIGGAVLGGPAGAALGGQLGGAAGSLFG
jgi:hypothetical protein